MAAASGGNGFVEVSKALADLHLEIYAPKFDEQGYDDLAYLRTLPEPKLREVAAAIGMKPGHVHKFVDAMLGGISKYRAAQRSANRTV